MAKTAHNIVLFSYSSLVQDPLNLLFLFSLDYNWSWLLLPLSFYLLYVSTYSANIYYWMYSYCTG